LLFDLYYMNEGELSVPAGTVATVVPGSRLAWIWTKVFLLSLRLIKVGAAFDISNLWFISRFFYLL
jgi:hypothetical protein